MPMNFREKKLIFFDEKSKCLKLDENSQVLKELGDLLKVTSQSEKFQDISSPEYLQKILEEKKLIKVRI